MQTEEVRLEFKLLLTLILFINLVLPCTSLNLHCTNPSFVCKLPEGFF